MKEEGVPEELIKGRTVRSVRDGIVPWISALVIHQNCLKALNTTKAQVPAPNINDVIGPRYRDF